MQGVHWVAVLHSRSCSGTTGCAMPLNSRSNDAAVQPQRENWGILTKPHPTPWNLSGSARLSCTTLKAQMVAQVVVPYHQYLMQVGLDGLDLGLICLSGFFVNIILKFKTAGVAVAQRANLGTACLTSTRQSLHI
jgi:hypothetical protein